jgi:hypothetical protein
MRCDAHAVALALALGLCCSLCLVPLREVLQVKLKLLACAKAVAALVVGQHVMPRRFPRAWVARCPNCKEQGCRDRLASRPLHCLQARSATSDAKRLGRVEGRFRVASMHDVAAAAVLGSGAENLDNQKIRRSGEIITIRMDQVLQRIIVLGFDSSKLMASKSFGPSILVSR